MVRPTRPDEKLQFYPGVHAAISDDDSFPRTGAHAWARRRMFRAALTSRSCRSPQRTHNHRLTISPLTPRGPVGHPHEEQVTLVAFSLTTENDLAACWLLYSRKFLSMPRLLSNSAFAARVLRSLMI